MAQLMLRLSRLCCLLFLSPNHAIGVFNFCPNVLILSCSFPLLFSPTLKPFNPSGPPSLEWRIVWTGWMMQSLFWGTTQWAPPPVCPVTCTVCWDKHKMGQSQPLEQASPPLLWFQIGLRPWYQNFDVHCLDIDIFNKKEQKASFWHVGLQVLATCSKLVHWHL